MTLRTLARGIGLLVCVLLATAIAAPAEAGQLGKQRDCVAFAADGVGQDLGGGQTQATISVRGHRVGTTTASLTIGAVSGATATFTGPLVFTPVGNLGTVTAQLTGTFDVVSGAFAAHSTSVTGTGVLQRVTGSVTVQGTQDLTTGAFTETLTGTLCIERGHRSALTHAVGGR